MVFLSPNADPLIILKGPASDVTILKAMQKVLKDPYGKKGIKKIENLERKMEKAQKDIDSENIRPAKNFLQMLLRKKKSIEAHRKRREKQRKISVEEALKVYKAELRKRLDSSPDKTISAKDKRRLDNALNFILNEQYMGAAREIRGVFFDIYRPVGQKVKGSEISQELFGYIDKTGTEEVNILEKEYEDSVLELSVTAEKLLEKITEMNKTKNE